MTNPWKGESREAYLARQRKNANAHYQRNKERLRVVNREKARAKLPAPTRPEPTLCECCGHPPKGEALHLDHCHLTDMFRGWLCGNCNRGIGMLGDNLNAVLRAAAYLQRSEKS